MGLRTYVVGEPAERVKIRLLSHVIGDAGEVWYRGEVHACDANLARELARRGRAEYIGAPPKEG
ncbi:MAG TPA: hypothetical protein VIL25_03820 [Vicinamibacterales bacterium]